MYQGARDEPLYFKYSSLRENNIPISSQRTKNDEIQSLNIGSYFVALIFTEIISTYDAHSNMFQFLKHAYEPDNESYVNLNLFSFWKIETGLIKLCTISYKYYFNKLI